MNEKAILVTGSPRSGTTWVGRTIAKAPSVHYIHEPFNISRLPCHCGVRFDYWFYYVSSVNESDFLEHLVHTIHPTINRISLLNLIAELKATKRIRPLRNYVRLLFKHRPLVKAPLAVFSAQWLAETFDMDVVIVIRHPAAVVNSYKTLKWQHPFSHFLKQPALMAEHLADFAVEITDFIQNDYDIIDQTAMLWKLIHHMILKYRQIKPEWIFVYHRDLSLDPIYGFQTIFDRMSLSFSDKVRRAIESYSAPINPIEAVNPYSTRRQSEQTIWSWKDQLTPEEICRIRRRVEPVSQAFFKEEDW